MVILGGWVFLMSEGPMYWSRSSLSCMNSLLLLGFYPLWAIVFREAQGDGPCSCSGSE